jgi:hypothetical protein
MTFAIPSISIIPRMTRRQGVSLAFAVLLTLLAFGAMAAGTTGAALQQAYTALNDMVGGYGKQILMLMGFTLTAFGYLATNASGVVMKFIGYAIFLGVGLAAATTLVGAVI